MPSPKALPLVAFVLYGVMLIFFNRDANTVHAEVLRGLLLAWTPILIIAGAIFLFKTMEATGALATISFRLNQVSNNRIAQLMIVGWAFPFLIEGASGFGTPAAIAAPILVGLGFPAIRVAILSLIMNSIPVSFGAVGTPTWFGFSTLTLSTSETLEIGFKSAVINSCAALVIPIIALSFIVKMKSIRKNLLFIFLSILSTIIPHLLVSRVSYEFPSLIGGAIGLITTILLAKYKVGLSTQTLVLHEACSTASATDSNTPHESLFKATFPLWGTLLLLIITRIPQLGIKQLLTLNQPTATIHLGSLGTFSISPALVVKLEHIFGTFTSWSHSLLYVPSLLPFGLISLLTYLIYNNKKALPHVFEATITQMKKPTYALLGALVFVNLMMMGGETSAVNIIGQQLAQLTGHSWTYFASLLGALGSFFSGSNTISNLTFGGIQDAIATDLGLNRTTLLAIQSVGGAMGNMICINNIVAVASVLALDNIEGFILKRTIKAMLIYACIVALVAFVI